jgi:intraflagellar transport protein 80
MKGSYSVATGTPPIISLSPEEKTVNSKYGKRITFRDSYGRLLYSSSAFDYVINSIRWAPNGEYFAVGAFEMLKLCDKTGWTYSFNKTNVGSLMKLCWSSDSTICAGAGGNGQVLFANIADKVI